MTALNIVSALCAVGITTWLLYYLADLNSAREAPRFGDMTSAGIDIDEAGVRAALDEQAVVARRQFMEAQ